MWRNQNKRRWRARKSYAEVDTKSPRRTQLMGGREDWARGHVVMCDQGVEGGMAVWGVEETLTFHPAVPE